MDLCFVVGAVSVKHKPQHRFRKTAQDVGRALHSEKPKPREKREPTSPTTTSAHCSLIEKTPLFFETFLY